MSQQPLCMGKVLWNECQRGDCWFKSDDDIVDTAILSVPQENSRTLVSTPRDIL